MEFWVTEVRKLEEKCQLLSRINPERYENLTIHLLHKYVDDCVMALRTLRRGVIRNMEDQALVWSREWELEDRDKSPEVITMTAIASLASSIVKCLNFTYDCPDSRTGTKMPVLDTYMWVGLEQSEAKIPEGMIAMERMVKTRTTVKNVVLYSFYRKPMCNQVPNWRINAAPESQKVATVSQELIRRMKNTSRDLPEEIMEATIREYMEELEEGGYLKEWRGKVLLATITGFERMWVSECEGKGRINRAETSTRTKRRWSKLCGKSNWFKKKKKAEQTPKFGTRKSKLRKTEAEVEGVLYVPYTEGSFLKNKIQKVEDSMLRGKSTGRIRVVERLGPSISTLLCNPAPWRSSHCGRPNCAPCKSKEGSCKSRGVTYEICCLDCKEEGVRSVYLGETHRTLWDRIREHMDGLDRQTEANCLVKHWRELHSGHEAPKFEVKVRGRYKTATERQVAEGVLIETEKYDHLLNSKTEWGRNSIPRQVTQFDRETDTDREARQKNNKRKERPQTVISEVCTEETDLFKDQYSQRRKRIRVQKKLESEGEVMASMTHREEMDRGRQATQDRSTDRV